MNEIDRVCFETSADLCENHRNLQKRTNEKLKEILSNSSLLRDIDYDVTPDELESQIAVATGDSIKVYVKRDPYPKLRIIVPANGSTVATLKKAIKWQYTIQQRRDHNRLIEDNSSERISTSHRSHRKTTKETKNSSKSSTKQEPITKISWKYVWRTFYLEHNGECLKDDRKKLVEVDIRNKTVLNFVKKSKERKRLKRRTK